MEKTSVGQEEQEIFNMEVKVGIGRTILGNVWVVSAKSPQILSLFFNRCSGLTCGSMLRDQY